VFVDFAQVFQICILIQTNDAQIRHNCLQTQVTTGGANLKKKNSTRRDLRQNVDDPVIAQRNDAFCATINKPWPRADPVQSAV
jgi:hypothetical protein